MRQFWPAFVLFFRMRIIPRKTHDFFYNIVTSVLRAREMGIQEKRGDFIDMMMALKSDDRNNNGDKRDDGDVEIRSNLYSEYVAPGLTWSKGPHYTRGIVALDGRG
ncbi:hypothetical protein EVAR_65356_1 [Eumeta japonica]|uniref:Uncharacterized protein n=1 Tax=Eumeta variegata TaxID=151549 RepID=A0A4C1Z3K8_EUMVA|nr:hypothetical protein EVAR_65356_1 [Eumeta japonica]